MTIKEYNIHNLAAHWCIAAIMRTEKKTLAPALNRQNSSMIYHVDLNDPGIPEIYIPQIPIKCMHKSKTGGSYNIIIMVHVNNFLNGFLPL